MKDILSGDLVRLSAFDPEEIAKAYFNWMRDSELQRLFGSEASALYSEKSETKFFEKMVKEENPANHFFSIRKLEDNRLLGDINLDVVNEWGSRDAFVGLGIGDRNDWGKGYGTDAMKIILRFAFAELNLRRVTLTVFEYNPRAIRSYEKAGFRHEGRLRGALLRDGKRWDILYMGILAEEWKEMNP
ncbi:MAG: GNAT family N-acetyltransferase [Chloroflexi bacterium]|nr:GNAT family N-acetyltransferase [Chloroflexota bacterium]MCA2001908.1 GNAT family N-acetyltransferase [Chloroflexota bacterium]